MITIALAAAVAERYPSKDWDRVTEAILAKLKRHHIRLLQDGEVLLKIAERLPEPASKIMEPA
jgi:hypothetical protein